MELGLGSWTTDAGFPSWTRSKLLGEFIRPFGGRPAGRLTPMRCRSHRTRWMRTLRKSADSSTGSSG